MAQTIRYVKPTQAGAGNGLSWDDASADVQAMINAVASAGGVVLVSGGVYKPTPGNSRYASFSILSGVTVYGNCSGTETGPEQRTLTNPSSTTFSGNIGAPESTTDNSFHVVSFESVSPQTRLDGVVITEGVSGKTGFVFPEYVGAGVYNSSLRASSNPVIANCQFVGNEAVMGGGLYNYSFSKNESSPTIQNCRFQKNLAYAGGAIYNDGRSQSQSSPVISTCQFSSNTALGGYGGAIYNNGSGGGKSSPVFSSCSFIQNQADAGGAVYNGGSSGGDSSPTVVNCEFSQNTATTSYGGGVFSTGASNGRSVPAFVNCTFSRNVASDYYQGYGGGLYSDGNNGMASPKLINCIMWQNRSAHFLGGSNFPSIESDASVPVIINSDIEKLANITPCSQCSGNLSVDPLFVNSLSNNTRLLPNSPVINKGTSTTLLTNINTDLAGFPRVSDCVIDMGAYEYQPSGSGVGVYTLRAGQWNDPTVWSCGQIPNQTDLVSVNHSVSIPDGYVAKARVVVYGLNTTVSLGVGSSIKLGL